MKIPSKLLIAIIITCTVLNFSIPIYGIQETLLYNQQDSMQLLKASNPLLRINDPLSSKPLFARPGDLITIYLSTTTFNSMFIQLHTAYEPVIDEYTLDILHIQEKKEHWEITTQIPTDITPELYNLTVIAEIYGTMYKVTQPRAVSVIEYFKDTFTFVHLTDLHVGDPRGLVENVKETIGYKNILRCIDEINLLNPDFVIITGDLVYGKILPRDYTKEYELCFELIQKFDVPTFLVPGNHDGYRRLFEDGLKIWNDFFGPHYYSFTYGSFHFQGLNSYDWPRFLRWYFLLIPLNWGGSIGKQQLEWIEQDLQQKNASYTCMFLHHNPLWDTRSESLLGMRYQNRKQLLSLIQDYKVDMVFAGHVHYDNVTTDNGTQFITTTAPSSRMFANDAYWGYRLIEVEEGVVTRYNYKEPHYSIPSYYLHSTTINPYTIVVRNQLKQSFSVLVKFIVPKGTYLVNHGSIILERENVYQKQVYVEVDIPLQSKYTIQLTQV